MIVSACAALNVSPTAMGTAQTNRLTSVAKSVMFLLPEKMRSICAAKAGLGLSSFAAGLPPVLGSSEEAFGNRLQMRAHRLVGPLRPARGDFHRDRLVLGEARMVFGRALAVAHHVAPGHGATDTVQLVEQRKQQQVVARLGDGAVEEVVLCFVDRSSSPPNGRAPSRAASPSAPCPTR